MPGGLTTGRGGAGKVFAGAVGKPAGFFSRIVARAGAFGAGVSDGFSAATLEPVLIGGAAVAAGGGVGGDGTGEGGSTLGAAVLLAAP